MESKDLQPVKLGFFQKLRKNFYLRGMNLKKAANYTKLPPYLMTNSEVIEAVVDANPTLINEIPAGNIQSLVEKNPELMEQISSFDKKTKIINNNPQLGIYLNQDELYTLVFNRFIHIDRSFIEHLPPKVQYQLLSNASVEYKDAASGIKTYSSSASLHLEEFSEDLIIQYALAEEKRPKTDDRDTSKLLNMDLTRLSPETQMKLLYINNKYASSKISPEVIEDFVGDNPLLFDLLPENVRKQKIIENPSIVKTLPKTIQWEEYLLSPDMHPIARNALEYDAVRFNIKEYSSPEDAKNDFIKRRYNTRSANPVHPYKVSDIKNNEFLCEMGKFDPTFMEFSDSCPDPAKRNKQLLESIQEYVKNKNQNSPIIPALEEAYQKKDYKQLNHLVKLVMNDDVMEKVSSEELLDYAKKPTHQKLVEIIRQTYGDKSAQILEDRPRITIDEIPNTYIFHPDIIQEFNIGAVHATLSYRMNASSEFSELARYPEKMKEYREFSKITDGFFEDTAIDLDRKLVAFEYSKELLGQIPDVTKLTDAQKENLYLAINDIVTTKEQVVLPFPTSIQELNTYKSQRARIYDEAIAKTSDSTKIKNYICQRFMGMDYTREDANKNLSENTAADMCRFYNIKGFVNAKETLESGNFTQDDLDALEAMDIISSTEDVPALKDIASSLSENESIINNTRYQNLSRRVPRQYAQEMINQLISPEKAESMLQQGMPGISIRENDDIKIITLDGADFFAYVTNPYLGNSGLDGSLHNIGLETDEVDKIWKEFENGVSTWSGCAISQDEAKCTIAQNQMGFGFSNIDSSQIVAMSATDARLSHNSRELNANTTGNFVEFNYSSEFMNKTAKRLEGDDPYRDSTHKYNEIASQRRVQKLSEIQPNTYGGKTMPDYIYTYGKNSGENGIQLAKKFGLKYIIEYNEEAYMKRTAEKERKEATIQQREDSNFMKGLKNISQGEER